MTRKELLENPPEDHKLILNKNEFHWYKEGLNVEKKYDHRHDGGEPKEYPVAVSSTWCDDPNGPYYYFHSFRCIKIENIKCGSCGHVDQNYSWGD